jgi:putative acetyltransferase
MEIRKMYLLNSHRGLGLGKRLLQTMVQEASNLQCEEIVLDTASVLVQAIKLYRSFGFVEFKPEHLPARCDLAMKLVLKT